MHNSSSPAAPNPSLFNAQLYRLNKAAAARPGPPVPSTPSSATSNEPRKDSDALCIDTNSHEPNSSHDGGKGDETVDTNTGATATVATSPDDLDEAAPASADDLNKVRTLFVSGLPMDAKPRELYLLFRAYKGFEGSLLKVTNKNGKNLSVTASLCVCK